MAYCTNCGRKIEETFDFCPECGSKITTDSISSTTEYINFEKNERMKICPECRAEMPEDAFYCLNCGRPFEIARMILKKYKCKSNDNLEHGKISGWP